MSKPKKKQAPAEPTLPDPPGTAKVAKLKLKLQFERTNTNYPYIPPWTDLPSECGVLSVDDCQLMVRRAIGWTPLQLTAALVDAIRPAPPAGPTWGERYVRKAREAALFYLRGVASKLGLPEDHTKAPDRPAARRKLAQEPVSAPRAPEVPPELSPLPMDLFA